MPALVPRFTPVTDATRRRRVALRPLLLLVAGLSIALTGVVAVRPAPALALSTFATQCDGVVLRSRPYASATKLATLSRGITVVAVDKVSGGSWRTTCSGSTATGSSWYKITVANGKDVRSRFGVSYVYGASSLFRRLASNTTTTGKSVRVSSIPALLRTLADNSVDEIVVANGTYHVSPSGHKKSDSLWIGGDRFANRTRPITVRAETVRGVTFDGGGATTFGALSFEDGAHHQTWDGFRFTNMRAEYTGIIEVGGYTPRRPPHNITLRNMTITSSCRGRATTADGRAWDHGIYIANAAGVGPHDLRFENMRVNGRGNLASAIHVFHGDRANPPAWNVTVRGLRVAGTQQGIILWQDRLRNYVFDGAYIDGARANGIRFEAKNASGIVFKNITTVNSGRHGFYSSMGTRPPGVTFSNNSFR